jgi:hypothetical protein
MQALGDFRLSTSKSRPVPPTFPARKTEGKEELRTVSYVDNVASFWCDITDVDDTHSKHSGGAASSSTGSAPSLYNNLFERLSTHPSTASSVTVAEDIPSERSLTDCYYTARTPPGLEREPYRSEHLLDMWHPLKEANLHTSGDVIWHPSGDVDPKPIGVYTRNHAATFSSHGDALNEFLKSSTAADLLVGAEVNENGKKENGKSGTTLIDQVCTELGASVPRELLEAIDTRGLLEKIPRNEHQQLTSIGSIGHSMDVQCQPCLFWFRGRCSKGILCEFCHYVHEGQRPKRIRAAKNTRLKMRDGEMRKASAT